jgi:hypothetical protein
MTTGTAVSAAYLSGIWFAATLQLSFVSVSRPWGDFPTGCPQAWRWQCQQHFAAFYLKLHVLQSFSYASRRPVQNKVKGIANS